VAALRYKKEKMMFKMFFIVFLLFTPVLFALDAGDKAADFSLTDTEGKAVNLADYNGKTVVLIFTSTKCPYSNAFNQVMSSLAADYGTKDVVVIGVNSNKNETVQDVALHSKQNLKFPVLKDADDKVADAYGAQVTPEAFVIDKTGTIRYHGALGNSSTPTTDASKATSNEIREAIDAVIAGKEVAKAKTKAFGCSIKRAA
jgi:peroxiredoxin